MRTGREGVWQRWLRLHANAVFCMLDNREGRTPVLVLGSWALLGGLQWEPLADMITQCEGWVGEEATLKAGCPLKHCSLSADEW